MATYIIGDVHGCFSSLMALIRQIQFSPRTDRLVFVGDLINKGPDSLSVLRYVKSLGHSAEVVLGNHDISLLAYAIGAYKKPSPHFDVILQASDANDLLNWLRHRPILWKSESLNALVIHAGIDPLLNLVEAKQLAELIQKALSSEDYAEYIHYAYQKTTTFSHQYRVADKVLELVKQGINSLTRMRYCHVNGVSDLSETSALKSVAKGRQPWYEIRRQLQDDKETLIFFGHWAHLGLYQKYNYCCLDSGCVYKKSLTAVMLSSKSMRFISVPYQK